VGLRDRLRGIIAREAPRPAPALRVVASAPALPTGAPKAVTTPVGRSVRLDAVPFASLGTWARTVSGPVTIEDPDPLRAAAAAERLAALGVDSHWMVR
jgi:hypothetical protein